ncbi:MAG TPA: HAMP domain-containing sensor histidine kinase [Myxococcota bacterium]|nr:HAMP domain-containing sensor histidine kinase [Myxococcota bacterium]
MSAGVLFTTAAGVVGLYAACFHGWVFAQHRPAREHLWVALIGASVAMVCFGAAIQAAHPGPGEALFSLRLQIAGAVGVTLGVLRFGASRFGIEAPVLLRSADGFCAGVIAVDVLAPHLLIALDRPPLSFRGLADSFHQYEITDLSAALLVPVLGFLVASVGFALRALRRGQPGARPLVAALAVWLAAAVLDSAAALRLTDLPLLLSTGGYPALVITVSAVLMRDLVHAMDDSERLGERFQRLAHERADELRAVDAQLARGEQLAAIGTLAAGVAHEINNPLAYVNANLNHLRELWEEKESDPRDVAEVLAECREGLARVSAIASDLLRMARHGASEREAVDLSEVVRSVLPLVQREAAGRVRLAAALAPALPVHGSARLLGQVALNLIWNAIHAAGDGSRAARIEVTTHGARGAAELCVADNGPGIPSELLAQVFEPSFTSRPIGQGTGLGLALVRLIVKRHGGEIRAESDAAGTRVRVLLPLRPAEAEP